MPARGATTLRVLGSLVRFQPDTTVPVRLVEQLHGHIVSEWSSMLDTLETFKLVVVDGERCYLTAEGVEVARRLSGVNASPGPSNHSDPSVLVLRALNQPCFARSHDPESDTCGQCPVRQLCQWNLSSYRGEVGFKLQHSDDQERERIRAELEAQRRIARIESDRLAREEKRRNAPGLRSMVDRLWENAAAKGNPEAQRRLDERGPQGADPVSNTTTQS